MSERLVKTVPFCFPIGIALFSDKLIRPYNTYVASRKRYIPIERKVYTYQMKSIYLLRNMYIGFVKRIFALGEYRSSVRREVEGCSFVD